MTPPIVIAAGLLGGVGAVTRFALDGLIAARARGEFPFGTLVVNILGSLALGVLASAAVDQNGYRLLGTGLIGAFTTFSTWALESHRLGEDGQLGLGAFNFAVSLALGIAAAWAGQQIGGWVRARTA